MLNLYVIQVCLFCALLNFHPMAFYGFVKSFATEESNILRFQLIDQLNWNDAFCFQEFRRYRGVYFTLNENQIHYFDVELRLGVKVIIRL